LEIWHKRIGYIPQTIFICDDTIRCNIAFGVDFNAIDDEAVARAVRLAGLLPMVASKPDGLQTVVGDRGIRLSGGERQRIGIARALYNDPEMLILDEATSALDNETERLIMDEIYSLSPAKTIVIIAHRLSTVERCDRIFLMEAGQIVDVGRFDEIKERHPEFVNPARKTDSREAQVVGS
jgi:ABC-type multidrug transport system fused ATPase/permease subunit